MVIGAQNLRGPIGNYLNADLDDLPIYDNVLSASQVASLVPEPASVAMMVVAAGCLAMFVRSR
ncbi:MAG: PEP-CTERM sorting domain-containing protein [Pirellulales bacterium]